MRGEAQCGIRHFMRSSMHLGQNTWNLSLHPHGDAAILLVWQTRLAVPGADCHYNRANRSD